MLIYAASNLPLLASERGLLGSTSLSFVSNNTPTREPILSSPKNRDLNKAIGTARSHTVIVFLITIMQSLLIL